MLLRLLSVGREGDRGGLGWRREVLGKFVGWGGRVGVRCVVDGGYELLNFLFFGYGRRERELTRRTTLS